MAERVLELSGPIAVELVLDRPQLLRARLQSALEGAVDVLDVDQHRHRGAPDGLRPADVHVRVLVRDHDHGVADLELRVADPSVGRGHAHALLRAEDRAVELDRLAGAVDVEIRRHTGVTVRNGLHGCHWTPCRRSLRRLEPYLGDRRSTRHESYPPSCYRARP